jgi:hypothetical protein
MSTQSLPSNSSPKSGNVADAAYAELEALRAENARLKAAAQVKAAARLTVKITDKGGVSVYGIGRFPVTLYPSQWLTLFENMELVTKVIADNAAELERRGAASKLLKAQEKAAGGPVVGATKAQGF